MSELSESDEWETPSEIFYWMIHKYKFNPTLDVCATDKNSQLDKFFTKEDDGLKQNWDPQNWCNPPAHYYKQFVEKAFTEFKNFANETMMILPSNCICTRYAEKYIISCAEFYPIIGRINFLHFGKNIGRCRNSYFVVIWRNEK